MKKSLLALCFMVISALTIAQVITPFTVQKTITQKGGIVYLSNTSSKATPDNIVQNEIPPAGTGYDNNFANTYVDIDTDPSTFMSSSDQLNLPSCSEISWAGLYWGADCSSGDENFATRDQVKLKVNSGTYMNLTADYLKDNTVGYRTYHCFKNITSILQANGLTDRYTVANVANDIGGTNLFGGWTIVVIYKNNLLTMKNLTVFDGLANVSAGANSIVDIPISGFQTPLSGPVNFELGMVVYDGDRSLTGDQLMFKGGTAFVNLSDALHPSSDMFNSTLARNGVLTPLRIPSFNNTLGYDANIFSPNNSLKNYIGNNAISAVIRQTTGGETYLTQVVTSAIDVYEPDLRSAVRVKNITHPAAAIATPGDTLEYTVNGLNIGSDPAINTYITDTIEGNGYFIPGSISITYGPNAGVKTDVAGDDQAEYIAASKVVKVRIGTGANNITGGLINNSPSGTDSTQFKFRVKISSDCVYLNCDNVLDNNAFIIGTGNISGNTFNNASNPGIFNAFGCPVSGTTKSPISITSCSSPTISASSPICSGSSIFFDATSSPSATYSWSGPNGFTSSVRQPTITGVSALNAGTYTANINVSGTSCQFTYTLVADISIANAGLDQTDISTCGLTTTTLSANTPIGATGVWSIVSGVGGDFGIGHTSTTNVANSTFNGISGNTYTLRWSLTKVGCSSTTDDVVITFNSAPSSAILSGVSITCANHLNASITGGIAPYTININNGVGSVAGYTSGADIFVNPLATTQYSITSVVGANGCSALLTSGNPTITVTSSMGTGTVIAITAATEGAISTAGPKMPTSGVDGGGSKPWSNPSRVTTSNNSYATFNSSGSTSNYLNMTNFGFSIPLTATITGIYVQVEKKAGVSSGSKNIKDANVEILGGTGTSSNLANTTTNWSTSESYIAYGNSTQLWGMTWTPAQVNATGFGVRLKVIQVGSSTASVDNAKITIYYTSPSSLAYCDNASSVTFSVTGYTNTTGYTWTPPTGASIVSGQGTSSATMNFNGAGQSGNYAVIVTPSNACGSGVPASLTIPITDCANTTPYCIMGNVYWDYNGNNKVDGVPTASVGVNQLYVSAAKTSGTTTCFSTVPVNADGTWQICNASVASSTSIKLVLSSVNYSVGTSSASMLATLPSGSSNIAEINNDLGNTLTGNDGSANGALTFTTVASMTNNETNLNFGIKIPSAPTANKDESNTNEDTPISFSLTTNDTDLDGTISASTVSLSTLSSNGTWSFNATGIVTYSPSLNFNGIASITYKVKDNDGIYSNNAVISVTVNPVNDPPVATGSSITMLQNTTYTFTAANFNYSDVEINAMTGITIASLPSLGSLEYNGTPVTIGQTINSGNITNLKYTPLFNQFGAPYTTFTFKVNDASLGIIAGTMTINVTHVNVAPTAINDVATTTQSVAVTFNILSNDINVDGTITPSSIDLDPLTPLQQSSLTIPGQGTFVCNSAGTVTFTPSSSFYGNTTTIYYTVNNSLSLTSNQASIIVNVIPAGAPVAVNDSATTTINTSINFSAVINDSGINTINPSRVDFDPYTSGIQQSYYAVGKGQFLVDMTGSVTFIPDLNYSGTVTVQYTVKDNLNLVSNIATIKVKVNWANSPPIAVDDYNSTNEDVPVTFNILPNDYDIDVTHGLSGLIEPSSVDLNPLSIGTQTSYTVVGQGVATVNSLGDVTFTPVLNFNGVVNPIEYTIKDKSGAVSDSALIYITVSPVNDSPLAINDGGTSVATSSTDSFTFSIVSNDSDIDGTIDPTTVDLDPYTSGVQTIFTVASEGTYSIDAFGNITFSYSFITPTGTLTPIHYVVKDDLGLVSNIGAITVTVMPQGIPLAVDDEFTTNEDIAISYDVTGNDIDDYGLTPGIDAATVGLTGVLTTTAGTWSITDPVLNPGEVTFTPSLAFFGTASTTYTVLDLDGNLSNSAVITVTVLPVNDAPTFVKGSNQIICENSGVQILNLWATSISAGPANESTQTYSFSVTNNNNILFSTQPNIDASGNLYFIPALNQNGVATVSISLQDNGGTANGGIDTSPIQVFTITVNPSPALVITPSSTAICVGSPVTLSVSGALSYTWSTGATSSSITDSPSSTLVYVVNATGITGCVSTKNISIAVKNLPSVFASSSSATICSGSSVNLLASGASTYTWSSGATTPSTSVSPTSTSVYTVTGTNTLSCSNTSTVSITVNAVPSVSISASSSVICNGSSVNLSASGANTYTWNTGATTSSISVSPSSNTVYSVTGTSASGCINTKTVSITVNALPSVLSSASSSVICIGSSVNLLSSGANTYTWSTGATTSSISVSPLSNTVYTVTGSNASNCTNTSTVSITVNALPSVLSSASSSVICNGSSVNLSASGANTYAWSTGATTASISVSPVSNTVYTVTGTNASNCTNTNTVSITVNALPSVLSSASSSIICNGSSVTLSASGANTYIWNTGAITSTTSVSPISTSVYTVTGTNALNCSNTSTVSITVNALPSVSISASSSVICNGSSVNLSASGANSYTWNTGATTSSISVSPSSNTVYSVTGTSASGCVITKTISITVNALPSVLSSASSSVICNGSSVNLVSSGANTYTWSTGATTASISVSPTSTSSYTVTGANTFGCVNTGTVSITVNPLPSLSVTANPTAFCSATSGSLIASGAFTYTWNPGNLIGSTVVVSQTATTVYTVTGTNSFGCASTQALSVALNNCPTAISNTNITIQNIPITGNVATNDVNAVGGTFTNSQPTLGTGTLTMNSATGQYTYTPAAGYSGTATATYTLCNGSPVVCSSTSITFTIFPTLVANTDLIATTPSVTTTGTLIANDGGVVPQGTYSVSVTQPSSSTGTITLNSTTGQYTFTPNPSFTGSVITSYTVCNLSVNPIVCSTTTIAIMVGNVPVAVADANATIINTPVIGNLGLNDSGALPSLSPVFTASSVMSGTLTVNSSTGQYTYTPASGFTGTTTATYTLCNLSSPPCSTTSITFTVLPMIVANPDLITTTPSVAVVGNVLSNDLGVVSGATYSTNITQPSPSTGTITLNASTGSYTFTPNSTFSGTTAVTYTVCNTTVNPFVCSNSTIGIIVTPTVVAVADASATIVDVSINGNLGTNDVLGVSSYFTASDVTIGTGTLTVNPATGQYTYTPEAGYTGTTIATYTLCNISSPPCATTSITFTIFPMIVANPDVIATTPSVTTSGTLITNDAGITPEGTYSVTITQPSSSIGTITLNSSTGQYTFTPNPSYTGSITTTYTVCNISVYPVACSSTTITIMVGNVPVALDDENVTMINTSIVGDVSTNDIGTATALSPTFNFGSLTIGTGTLITNSATGQYTYTPEAGFTGTTTATYTLCNLSSPPCATAAISFTVFPALVARQDIIATTPSVSVTGNLVTNDEGIVAGVTYSVDVSTLSPTVGSINLDPATGNYTFTPNSSFSGSASVTYTLYNTSVIPNVYSDTIIKIIVGVQQVAAAKTVLSTTKINASTFQTVFSFNVANVGTLPATNVQLVDNLNNAFPLPITYSVVGVNAGSPLTINSGYNGNSITALLSGTNNLSISQNAVVTLTVNFTPNATTLTTLSNFGIASTSSLPDPNGDGSHLSIDTTATGTNPDPNSDGNPGGVGENNPTLFGQQIAASKSVVSLTNIDATTFQSVFAFNVTNVGPVTATNIQLVDNLNNAFPAPITYTVIGVNTTTPLTASGSYDGNSHNALLSGTNSLSSSQSAVVTLTINFSPNSTTLTSLSNIGFASTSPFADSLATGFHSSIDTTDVGNNPDENSNGNPNELGENDATVFGQQIGVAKLALPTIKTESGVNQTTFVFTVKNLGALPAINVQVADNLASVFPSPITYNVISLTSGSALTVNSAYNGNATINMFVGTNTLAVGATETITLVVNYSMNGSSETILFNSAHATTSNSNGVVLSSDISNSGNNCDTNGNGNPNDSDESTSTSFEPLPDVVSNVEFSIPQGFSPNGDGVNDLFVIKGIMMYPENEILILNRWGNAVYKKKGYDNTWNGKSMEGVRYGGDDLPEGTYFYILDLGNNEKPFKGSIYLNKSVK